MTLIDEIRRRKAAKRDVDIDVGRKPRGRRADRHRRCDRSLDDLAEIEPEAAMIVQLRFYVGLTMEEIAAELRISESTALRRWRLARAWLFKELGSPV